MACNHNAYEIYELLKKKDLEKATKLYHQSLDLNFHLKF